MRDQHQHVVSRANKLLNVGEHASEKRPEIGGPMVRTIRSHRHLRGRKKRSRTGSEESVLLEHENQRFESLRFGEKRSEVVRGQIAEVRAFATCGFHLCNLTSDLL